MASQRFCQIWADRVNQPYGKDPSARGANRDLSDVMKKKKPDPRDIVPPAADSLSPRGGVLHGRLKEHILELLSNAGEAGMTAQELSDELGVIKFRIQNWFSGTGKKCRNVKKIGIGRWRFSGKRSVA